MISEFEYFPVGLLRMKTRLIIIAMTSGFFLLPFARANAADVAGVFSQGRYALSVVGGTGYAFNESYFVFGVGASYYVIDGLSLGLNVQWWSGADPGIVKLTPSVEYVFYQLPSVKPYVGAFYRESYIDNFSNLASVGGRAGVFIPAGRNVHIGVGAAYEVYLNCDTSTYSSCTDTYPEVSVVAAF